MHEIAPAFLVKTGGTQPTCGAIDPDTYPARARIISEGGPDTEPDGCPKRHCFAVVLEKGHHPNGINGRGIHQFQIPMLGHFFLEDAPLLEGN